MELCTVCGRTQESHRLFGHRFRRPAEPSPLSYSDTGGGWFDSVADLFSGSSSDCSSSDSSDSGCSDGGDGDGGCGGE